MADAAAKHAAAEAARAFAMAMARAHPAVGAAPIGTAAATAEGGFGWAAAETAKEAGLAAAARAYANAIYQAQGFATAGVPAQAVPTNVAAPLASCSQPTKPVVLHKKKEAEEKLLEKSASTDGAINPIAKANAKAAAAAVLAAKATEGVEPGTSRPAPQAQARKPVSQAANATSNSPAASAAATAATAPPKPKTKPKVAAAKPPMLASPKVLPCQDGGSALVGTTTTAAASTTADSDRRKSPQAFGSKVVNENSSSDDSPHEEAHIVPPHALPAPPRSAISSVRKKKIDSKTKKAKSRILPMAMKTVAPGMAPEITRKEEDARDDKQQSAMVKEGKGNSKPNLLPEDDLARETIAEDLTKRSASDYVRLDGEHDECLRGRSGVSPIAKGPAKDIMGTALGHVSGRPAAPAGEKKKKKKKRKKSEAKVSEKSALGHADDGKLKIADAGAGNTLQRQEAGASTALGAANENDSEASIVLDPREEFVSPATSTKFAPVQPIAARKGKDDGIVKHTPEKVAAALVLARVSQALPAMPSVEEEYNKAVERDKKATEIVHLTPLTPTLHTPPHTPPGADAVATKKKAAQAETKTSATQSVDAQLPAVMPPPLANATTKEDKKNKATKVASQVTTFEEKEGGAFVSKDTAAERVSRTSLTPTPLSLVVADRPSVEEAVASGKIIATEIANTPTTTRSKRAASVSEEANKNSEAGAKVVTVPLVSTLPPDIEVAVRAKAAQGATLQTVPKSVSASGTIAQRATPKDKQKSEIIAKLIECKEVAVASSHAPSAQSSRNMPQGRVALSEVEREAKKPRTSASENTVDMNVSPSAGCNMAASQSSENVKSSRAPLHASMSITEPSRREGKGSDTVAADISTITDGEKEVEGGAKENATAGEKRRRISAGAEGAFDEQSSASTITEQSSSHRAQDVVRVEKKKKVRFGNTTAVEIETTNDSEIEVEAEAEVILRGWQELLRRRVKYPLHKSISNPNPNILVSDTALVPTEQPEGSLCRESVQDQNSDNSKIPYWDTLGRCRVLEQHFSWRSLPGQDSTANSDSGVMGYDAALGRVFYPSFFHRKHEFHVGDFVASKNGNSTEYFRILAAFQATKSFMGYWNSLNWNDPESDMDATNNDDPMEGTEEIQKRGHPYIITCSLALLEEDGYESDSKSPKKGGGKGKKRRRRSRKSTGGGGELCLCVDTGTSPRHIDVLPLWLGNSALKLQKVSVKVIGTQARVTDDSPAKDGRGPRFICRRGLELRGPNKSPLPSTRQLSSEQRALLTGSAEDLFMSGLLPTEWNNRFKAKQVEFVVEDRPEEETRAGHDNHIIPRVYTCESSDDSDGFEEEEEGD